MIKYIKENLESIGKLFINHIGMMVFGLVVLIASKMISDVLFYVMGVVAVLMYFSLIYTAMWERGAKDRLKIEGGRLKPNLFNGLWFYFIANFIAVFSSLISLLFSFFLTQDSSFVNGVYGVFRIITHYYNSMYIPITSIDVANVSLHSFIYVAVILPGAVVSFISYVLGVKGFKCIFPESKRDKSRRIR